MPDVVLVAAGGAIGASLRWWIGTVFAERLGPAFPWHTLLINVTGAFLLGLLMALSAERGMVGPGWQLFVGVGVLGGYTTFSTLSYETVSLMQDGAWLTGLAYIGGTVVAGLVAAALGLALGRAI